MDPIEQLTEPQRECLRMVLQHHNSKEIALRLGVSPSAVDKRIERAVQVLGATSRFAAARMLADAEADASDRIPWQSIDVPAATPAEQIDPAAEPWGLGRRLLGLTPGRRDAGNARVTLNTSQRVGVLLGMMLIIAVTSLVLLSLGATLSSLVEQHRRAPSRVAVE